MFLVEFYPVPEPREVAETRVYSFFVILTVPSYPPTGLVPPPSGPFLWELGNEPLSEEQGRGGGVPTQ